MKKYLIIICLFLSLFSFAEENVGIVKRMTFELEGEQIFAAEVDEKSPALVREINTIKTEKGFKYEIDFIGMEPGNYNVIDFMRDRNNNTPSGYKEIKVSIDTTLEESFKGQLSEVKLETESPSIWYTKVNVAFFVLWVIILLVIIFYKKKTDEKTEEEQKVYVPTAADKLITILEEPNSSTKERWQKIEGLLITHFCENQQEDSMHERFMNLKKDSSVGPIIKLLEIYLHAPDGSERVSFDELKSKIQENLGETQWA